MQRIFGGYLPTSTLFESPLPGHEGQLTLALGIVGATVRPHNLYLHSAFSQMYNALQDSIIAGAIASSTLSTLFALALLASGKTSTITGTLTGQIVMEGFLHLKLPQWMIRIGTRIFALLPVIIVAVLFGHQEKPWISYWFIHRSFCQSLFRFQSFL